MPGSSISFLAFTALLLGCEGETHTAEFRDGPAPVCSVEAGDFGDVCLSGHCVAKHDFVLRCPGDVSVHSLGVALDGDRVWGHFEVQGGGSQAFRINGAKLKLLDSLPGDAFTGQAPDGTVYRRTDGAAYLRSDGNDWVEVAVDGLPANVEPEYGFNVRPDSTGALHAAFRTGNQSGNYRFASLVDGAWTWISMGSWDPNEFGAYVGTDADDRPHSLIYTGDWDGGDQVLLNFSHWDDYPVGAPGPLGRVAPPPRPGQDADGPPIATLREGAQGLSLLTVTDGEDWSEVEIAGTEPHDDVCPTRYFASEPICPPCESTTSGVEDQAYQLARTSDGALWGAWFVTDATIEREYTATPWGSQWRCVVAETSSTASGTLHLVELEVDGTPLRSLELALDDVGFYPNGDRELAIAAFGDQIALLVPVQHHADDGEVAVRVLVINTDKLE